ncbi:MAG: hypothetical protein M1830_001783 [Pleopsidium flavum]|nr:MAG: hypothetical protein M1830_001783 [Pleopsidium flavum]
MANRTSHRENNSDSEDYDSGSDSMILGEKSRRPAPPRHRGYDDGRRNGGRSREYNDGHRSTDHDPEPSISKPYITDHTKAQCRNHSIITNPLALYPGIDLRYGHAR